MQPTNEIDHKHLFTQLIQKQILILGPDITLLKVKNVPGIVVDQTGVVQSIIGDPNELLQLLINQFVELSGMIVKQTMESIITSNSAGLSAPASFGAVQTHIEPVVKPISDGMATPSALSTEHDQKHIEHIEEVVTKDESSASHVPKLPSMAEAGLHASGSVVAPASGSAITVDTSSKEMQDLNKALEDLAQSPVLSEPRPQAQGIH